MKNKFNYNIIVFVVVAILIVTAWFSVDMITGLKIAAKDLLNGGTVDEFIDDVDATSKKYNHRYDMIDIFSLTYLTTDTRYLQKDSDTIVRMDNHYLSYDYATATNEVIEKTADSCLKLSQFCKSQNIPFLYTYAPQKQYFGTFPQYVENAARIEGDLLVDALRKRKVDTLSLAESMVKEGVDTEKAYFITDHHWTAETGFWAATKIAQRLNGNYGFKYDTKNHKLENYNVKVYEDWFLGSIGKKTGRFFTPLGVDDISLITPKFDTNLEVTAKGVTRKGAFADTIIYKEKIETKSLHTQNPYAAYSGGDFPVQVIENKNATNDQTVLVIRDSFACTVTPFLALDAKTTYAVDLRESLHGNAVIKSVSEFIKQNKVDYVCVLYSGLPTKAGGTAIAQHYEFN